jgi:tight adherence protein B
VTLPLLAATLVLLLGLAARPSLPARSVDAKPIAGEASDRDLSRLRGRWRLRHRSAPIDPADVANWCDALSRSLRGRSTLVEAVRSNRAVPRIELRLARVRLAIDRGTPLGDALAGAVGDDQNLDMALIVLRTCALHGGSAAEPIDRAGAALRQRAALAAERRGHSAQARLSAHVMTALPSLLLVVMLASSASVRATVGSPLGAAVVGWGAALNALGWWWMRRLIDGAAQ